MQTTSSASPFENRTCSAPAERVERMRDIVLQHMPHERAIEVLDVGCGTGSLAFQLADALPQAHVTGVDISAANIRAAENERALRGSGRRVRFEAADYLAYRAAPVDAIVTDTVLHFVRGEDAALWGKLSTDLRAGGILVCCMGYTCAHNRALALLRRGLRRVRSRALDLALLAAAWMVYGRGMDVSRLRERTEYMFIPPERLMTRATRERVAPSAGLRFVAEYDMPGTSWSQLRQRATVFKKEPRA